MDVLKHFHRYIGVAGVSLIEIPMKIFIVDVPML